MSGISRRGFVKLGIGAMGAFGKSVEPHVEISVSVLRQDNCRADSEVGFIRLDLKCNLVNKGVSPVVVAGEPKPPHVILLALSLADFKAGKFAHEYSTSWYSASEPVGGLKTLPVPPGKSHEWRTRVQIPVSNPMGRGRSVVPGRYWMSVLIDLGPQSPSNRDSSQAWVVRSIPTLITITDTAFQLCP